MLYGIPRVTQVYGTIATTTSPQIDTREIDPLHNHSKSNKKHKNYHKYFMEQIRQHGSREGNSREEREERARNRVTHRGRKSPESQSSFASLFHNGQPMGYFSISQANGNDYPSIDFYPVDRYRNVKLPMS